MNFEASFVAGLVFFLYVYFGAATAGITFHRVEPSILLQDHKPVADGGDVAVCFLAGLVWPLVILIVAGAGVLRWADTSQSWLAPYDASKKKKKKIAESEAVQP